MSLIHILLEDGQQPAYEEDQVRDMLARQVITPETYFWKEGMAEWRPLGELALGSSRSIAPPRRTANPATGFESPARPLPTASEQVLSRGSEENSSRQRKSTGRVYFRRNPVPLTISMQVLMAMFIIASLVFIYQCLDKIYGWNSPSTTDPAAALLGLNNNSSGGQSGVFPGDLTFLYQYFFVLAGIHVVIEIMFFYWIYFANKNCRSFASNIIYTPGWAVAYFFIPIVNLFRPYQVVQEIWKVSENPRSWSGKRDSIFVGIWFLPRLCAIVLSKGPFHTAYYNSDNPDIRALDVLIYLATVEGMVILIVLTTFILISVVIWRQVRLVRNRS